MRVMAQIAMVMNLDKCIGCHTCSVTCKQTWTNRTGVEYAWFNNVETKPGVGYPRRYEDQEQWKGGWTLDRKGRLVLRSGGRLKRLLSLFSNPDLPSIETTTSRSPTTTTTWSAPRPDPTCRSPGPARSSPGSPPPSRGAPTGRTAWAARPSTRAATRT